MQLLSAPNCQLKATIKYKKTHDLFGNTQQSNGRNPNLMINKIAFNPKDKKTYVVALGPRLPKAAGRMSDSKCMEHKRLSLNAKIVE